MYSGTYVDVLLPVPVPGTFLYRITEEGKFRIVPGIRVVVPFGKKRTCTGIVTGVRDGHPEGMETKDVLAVLDNQPLVTDIQFRFWKWIADYYLCTEGEVMDAAIPGGLKPEFRQRLSVISGIEGTGNQFTEEEIKLINLLRETGPCNVEELSRHIKSKKDIRILPGLIEKGYISSEEYLEEKYKPKRISFLSLSPDIADETRLHESLDHLSRASRQKEVLLFFIEHWSPGQAPVPFEKSYIIKLYPSPGAVKALVQKGILVESQKQVSRLGAVTDPVEGLYKLNRVQKKALTQIEKQFAAKDVVLLHGITSSGKTELYFHLITKVLEQGRQVLYLLPEIAITTQMIRRLKQVFGSHAAIYHSRYSENERVETWLEIAKRGKDSSIHIVLGVRSAVFLPFRDLGLIIIDEEHETTYKQQNPSPRYHARDMAVVLAQIHRAKVLLGTATPSIETYYNARTGKYGLVGLNERFTKVALPLIRIVDMKKSWRRHETRGHLSEPLHTAMEDALKEGEQVILFQNRRGFSPFVQCNQCGWIPYCRNCDVRMTYHHHDNRLECHYCGYTTSLPKECSRCHSTDIRTRGFGTEKVEDEIKLLFPDARLSRLDLDTARTKTNYEKIIRRFEERQSDILIGTQMITKGLDFQHVQVVGILNADNLLHFPDFRAWERSFQLMTQVSGRAGRMDKQGEVYIQTWDPEHPVLQDIITYNYFHMYKTQLQERKIFGYPPYFRLIRILLKHRKPDIVNRGATLFAGELKHHFPGRVLGPESPVIPRIRNYWEKQILLKINREANLREIKQQITGTGDWLRKDKSFRSIRIMYDVDPV
ncbi:MAG: primosomal protein N' [Chlorobi bacterium]|nr:primosomal protein N' [Chlorobiota bacterium]